jgi:hypothetical protein
MPLSDYLLKGCFEGMIGEWRERVSTENERVTTSLLEIGLPHAPTNGR